MSATASCSVHDVVERAILPRGFLIASRNQPHVSAVCIVRVSVLPENIALEGQLELRSRGRALSCRARRII